MTARMEESSVEGYEARLATLRADQHEQAQHLGTLKEQIGEAMARGDEDEAVDGLLGRQVHAQARLEGIRRAIAEIEGLLPDARWAVAKAAAGKRITGIRRAFGSLVNAREDDLARLEHAAAEFAECMSRLNSRTRDLQVLLGEVLVLEHRFGVAVPALDRPARPAQDARVTAALERVRAALPSNATDLPPRLESMPAEGSPWSIKTLLARIASTPTGQLLNDVGPGDLGDPAEWERRRDERQRAARTAEAEKRQAEVEKVDGWLRGLLASGPVPIEGVSREAAKAGFVLRVRQDQPEHGTVYAAFERLGVAAIKARDGGAVFWSRGGDYDSDQFVPLHASSGLAAMRA
jgi:hypothetical protein